MNLLILDENLQSIGILDKFESLIWSERYSVCGDFEIYTTATKKMLELLKQDRYIWSDDSDNTMIIDEIQTETDAENGNKIVVTGNSLEYILSRRIIFSTLIMSGNLQNGIQELLNDTIISPSIDDRRIPNFIFEVSTDPVITALTVEEKYEAGSNVYDIVSSLCTTKKIGFRVTLTDDNKFKFKLYAGTDRSYEQLENPCIVFSPNFNNLINSNYLVSTKNLKTVTYVVGEGEDEISRKRVFVAGNGGPGVGLKRREMFTNASDISQTEDDVTISDAEYEEKLKQRGRDDLEENKLVELFEGETDTTRLFVYGRDFFKGDIVQIKNEHGIESRSRVVEFVRSQDSEGISSYPTFETVEQKGDNNT